MKRTYVIDGVEASYDDDWPEPELKKSSEPDDPLLAMFMTAPEPDWAERFVTRLADTLAEGVELLVTVPPFCWIDRILSGPVGRDR